jgi:hypothetical protein
MTAPYTANILKTNPDRNNEVDSKFDIVSRYSKVSQKSYMAQRLNRSQVGSKLGMVRDELEESKAKMAILKGNDDMFANKDTSNTLRDVKRNGSTQIP